MDLLIQPTLVVFAGIIETFAGRKYTKYFATNFCLISCTAEIQMSNKLILCYPPSAFISLLLSSLAASVKGLMESWSNVSGNYCYIRRNSRRSDTAVHCGSALLL